MEPKIITNSKIMQTKRDVLDMVNAELNQGVPISVLVLILESVLLDLRMALEQTIQKENEEVYSGMNSDTVNQTNSIESEMKTTKKVSK